MTEELSNTTASSEAVFTMDPEATMVNLIDLLVKSHRAYANMVTQTRQVHVEGIPSADAARVTAAAERFHRQYVTEALPSLIASLQLTAEVVRSFGFEPCRVNDPVEAAIWNNKWFVYANQLRPQAFSVTVTD
jgi:hypothetical protein